MRHSSRKRSAPDPLAPVNTTTWLVVRNRMGFVLESSQVNPYTDLRATLTTARNARISSGWEADRICRVCSFFFASRADDRIVVGIERREPQDPLSCRSCG
jgi:hypothetical protein